MLLSFGEAVSNWEAARRQGSGLRELDKEH